MRATVRLFRGLFAKEWAILKRYWLNTVGGILGAFMFFAVAFFGGQAIAEAQLDESLAGLVVGYFLVILGIAAYMDTTNKVTREAQWGTLEQLHMTPLGFGRVMLLQGLVTIAFSFIWGIGVLVLMLLLTGVTLSIDVITIVPIAILALCSVIGIGLMCAGVAVLYKRVEQLLNLGQFVVFGLVAAPVSGHAAVYGLPMAQGSAMLQRAMGDGTRLWEFSIADQVTLVGVGVGYLALGYLVFMWFTSIAKRRGVLGHY